jgi:tungstate transport system substrate-binding protein
MGIQRIILFSLSVLIGSSAIATDSDPLRMATTTSIRSSGLLDVLVPAFQKASGYKVELAVVGTGRALRLGRLGKVDIILVHAPAYEQQFVEEGWGVERQTIMKNDFILVGPPADPAGIRSMQNAGEALKRIAETASMFASRGDDSGTHKKEIQCWSSVDIQPAGSWYFEAGMTMDDTLKLASDEQYYTLVDRATWLKARKQIKLDLLVEGDSKLDNPYSVLKINPARHAGINFEGAKAFFDWLQSQEGRRLILNHRIDGEQLYFLPEGLQE